MWFCVFLRQTRLRSFGEKTNKRILLFTDAIDNAAVNYSCKYAWLRAEQQCIPCIVSTSKNGHIVDDVCWHVDNCAAFQVVKSNATSAMLQLYCCAVISCDVFKWHYTVTTVVTRKQCVVVLTTLIIAWRWQQWHKLTHTLPHSKPLTAVALVSSIEGTPKTSVETKNILRAVYVITYMWSRRNHQTTLE